MDKKAITETECTARLSSIADALYVIGGKWKLLIIVTLLDGGSRRFNELQRSIEGISAKVLSSELKDLERNGFIHREVFTGTPVVIEYKLSGYTKTLNGVLQALSEWGQMHKKKIKESMKQKKSISAL